MWPFECSHQFRYLIPKSHKTKTENIDADFNRTTFYLHCWKCGKDLDLKCSHFVGGVDAFMARGREKYRSE